MTQRWSRRLAWTGVGFAVATIPIVSLLVSQPHHGRLDIETEAPFAYVGMLAFSIVGALIVSRHPRHIVGWIFCLSGLSAGVSAVTTAYVELDNASTASFPAVSLVDAVSGVTFLVGFFAPTSIGLLLFPDGRLPSARWRPAVVAAVGALVLQFTGALLGHGNAIGDGLYAAGLAGGIAAALAAVASLAVRWRGGSHDMRQQLKWVAAAGAIVFLELIAEVLVIVFRPGLIKDPFPYFSLAYTCVPIAVGIAILRYRLYDIDFLINRAIVYVPLTAVLAGLYSAATALFQRVFVALTGQRSDGAIVITVFLLAVLFTPARNRLQALVDKRFKDPRDLERLMEALEHDVQSVVGVMSRHRLADRLLSEVSGGVARPAERSTWMEPLRIDPRSLVGAGTGRPRCRCDSSRGIKSWGSWH